MRAAVSPLVATAYHAAYARDPESVKRLPNGKDWLASVEALPERVRHLSVHRGHLKEIANGHDELVDTRIARRVTFTGTRDELQGRLDELEAGGATSHGEEAALHRYLVMINGVGVQNAV